MNDLLDALRSFESRLRATISGLGEADLRRPEREGKWSIAGVLAHLGDLEMVYAVRMRTILAGAGDAPLPALAQDAWVERVHVRDTIDELLEELSFHRRMNVRFLERLSEEELSRSGIHPQYGRITIRDAAERIVRHDAKHHLQIQRIKAAVTGA